MGYVSSLEGISENEDLFVFCFLSLPGGNMFFRVAVQNPENWVGLVGSDIFRISFMEPTVN